MPTDSLKAPQDHGGNRREVLERYDLDDLLDFSASINPLGHPEGLREQVQARWEQVLHYPDRSSAELVAAIAARHALPRDSILAGNGSSELIDLILRAVQPHRLDRLLKAHHGLDSFGRDDSIVQTHRHGLASLQAAPNTRSKIRSTRFK